MSERFLYTEGNNNAALDVYTELSSRGSRTGTSKASMLALEIETTAVIADSRAGR